MNQHKREHFRHTLKGVFEGEGTSASIFVHIAPPDYLML